MLDREEGGEGESPSCPAPWSLWRSHKCLVSPSLPRGRRRAAHFVFVHRGMTNEAPLSLSLSSAAAAFVMPFLALARPRGTRRPAQRIFSAHYVSSARAEVVAVAMQQLAICMRRLRRRQYGTAVTGNAEFVFGGGFRDCELNLASLDLA